MNRTKIDWAQYTWNPITGCLHGCKDCYAESIATSGRFKSAFPHGFEPWFYPERLSQPQKVKKGASVFVVSMGDLFGDWVSQTWIEQVVASMVDAPQHTYILLTKNPKRLSVLDRLVLPGNLIVGTSISGANTGSLIRTEDLIDATFQLPARRVISLEPFKHPLSTETFCRYGGLGIDWLIIGGQTGPTFHPPLEWVMPFVELGKKHGIPVFCKHNIGPYEGLPREYPVGVPHDSPTSGSA